MKIIKELAIIALAAFLIFQGLYYVAEIRSPLAHAAIGLLGLASGILMFISLGHWIDYKKDR